MATSISPLLPSCSSNAPTSDDPDPPPPLQPPPASASLTFPASASPAPSPQPTADCAANPAAPSSGTAWRSGLGGLAKGAYPSAVSAGREAPRHHTRKRRAAVGRESIRNLGRMGDTRISGCSMILVSRMRWPRELRELCVEERGVRGIGMRRGRSRCLGGIERWGMARLMVERSENVEEGGIGSFAGSIYTEKCQSFTLHFPRV